MGSFGQINIKAFCFNPFRENCYVLWNDGGDCVVVDPGCYDEAETSALREFISSRELSPVALWLTHAHFDHVFGVAAISRLYSVPVWMAPEDKVILEKDVEYASGVGLIPPDTSFETMDLEDGQILRFSQDDSDVILNGSDVILNGSEESPSFRVIATPGHTPGCVCFYDAEDGVLFSGDTLFAGSIGRTDLPGGDYDLEIAGIMDKLMTLPGDVEVYPGHGQWTTIAKERATNPFLQPWEEPWDPGID